MNSQKAAVVDEIQTRNVEGIEQKSRLVDKGVSGDVKSWKNTKNLADNVIISIYKKSDQKECTNYRRTSFLSFHGNVYEKRLERKCREKKIKVEIWPVWFLSKS